MKTISLIIKNIKYIFNFNKSVFLLFLIGIISSTLFLIYFYGNINPVKVAFTSDYVFNKNYNIRFNSEFDEETLKDYFYDNHEIEMYRYISYLKQTETEDDLSFETAKENWGAEAVCSNGSNFPYLIKIDGRNKFSDEELLNAENVVILDISVVRMLDGDINYGKDKITINGVDYTIIGSTDNIYYDFLFPTATYKMNGFKTRVISFTLKEKSAYYKHIDFINDLKSEFGESLEILNHPYDEYDELAKEATPILMIIMAFIFAVVSIAFLLLLKFLADNTNYVSVIYSICGASKETVLFIKLTTVLIITFCTSLLGILIHAIAYDLFFSKINILDNLTYTLYDYALIVIIACLASVIISIPFIITFARKSAIVNKNKFC